MGKKQGNSLKPHETKSYIIEYILDNSGSAAEPTIRKHLKEKHDLEDQGTINRHLHYLENSGCIELIKPEKEGLRNKWDITTVEHLLNIKEKLKNDRLKYIKLNTHEKSLMIVLKKNGYNILTLEGIFLYVKLLLSASFFNACIDTSVKILGERAWGIYQIKNPSEFMYIQEVIDEIYNGYITRYPDLNITAKSFLSMINQMSQREPEDSTEIFMKIWEEELLGLSKDILDEMHRGTMYDDLKIYERIRDITSELLDHKLIFENELFDLLFESYLRQDILAGVASEEEIKFLKQTDGYHEQKLKEAEDIGDYSEYNDNIEWLYLYDLVQIGEVLFKYKHPSTFGNIYNENTDVVVGIMKILDQHHELPALSDEMRDLIYNSPREQALSTYKKFP
jgi:hypothetical protein